MNVCIERDILPQFKKLTTDCFRATMGKMDPSKRVNTFEVYGLDFMLDENFKVYLIEVNTNPGLSEQSIIPQQAKAAGIKHNHKVHMDSRTYSDNKFDNVKEIGEPVSQAKIYQSQVVDELIFLDLKI